jgi:hypothetical protein
MCYTNFLASQFNQVNNPYNAVYQNLLNTFSKWANVEAGVYTKVTARKRMMQTFLNSLIILIGT